MKPMLVLLTLLGGLVAGHTQQTSPPPIEWQNSFGGSSDDLLNAVRQTGDGEFILGGLSLSGVGGNKSSPNFGLADFWIVRVGTNGNKLWDKSFGGSGWDEIRDLQPVSDGGFILGGRSSSDISGNKTNSSFGSYDFWVVRLDENGALLWERSFGGGGLDSLNALQQTSDGGFILGGVSSSLTDGNKTSANFGGGDYWVVRLDAQGDKLWEQTFGGSGEDDLRSLQETADGGLILGGSSNSETNAAGGKTAPLIGESDYWLVRLDRDGNKLWDRSLGSPGPEDLYSVKQTADDGFIFGGGSEVVRLDSQGRMIWNRTGNGLFVQSTLDGRFVAGGPAGNFWVWRLDTNGQTIWSLEVGGTAGDSLQSLQQTADRGFILGGYSFSAESGSKTSPKFGGADFWIVKLAPEGGASMLLSVNDTNRGSVHASLLPGPDGKYPFATVVTLTAIPNPGYHFVRWTGTMTGSNSPTDIAVIGDQNITAIFECNEIAFVAAGTPELVLFNPNRLADNTQTFEVWNSGLGTLNYSITVDVPWLSATPASGTSTGATNAHALDYDLSALPTGEYHATVTVAPIGDCTGPLQTIKVTLFLESRRIQWQHSFGGAQLDDLHSIQPLADGGFVLGGSSASAAEGNKTSPGFDGSDFWLVRLDYNGSKIADDSFGGTGDDFLACVQMLSDGGVLLGGYSNSTTNGNKTAPNFGGFDFWVVRLDTNWNKLWDYSFGGAGDDTLSCVQQTTDGGFILGGTSGSETNLIKQGPHWGAKDFWVVRLDADGTKRWDHSYGGTEDDVLLSLEQTADGGFILGGSSFSGINGTKTSGNMGASDYWIVRLDADGNQVWDRSVGGPGEDILSKIKETSDHGFILGGASASGLNGSKDFLVARLDSGGDLRWERAYGGTNDDMLADLQVLVGGGFVLGGSSASGQSGNKRSPNFGGNDFWVLRIGDDGNVIWEETYGGNADDSLTSLLPSADGGLLLGGFSSSQASGIRTDSGFGGKDYWVVRLGPQTAIRKTYQIVSGTYQIYGGLVPLWYQLPFRDQSFIELILDPGLGNARIAILDDNLQTSIGPFTNGIIDGREIRFHHNLVIQDWRPLSATLDYFVTNDLTSLGLAGIIVADTTGCSDCWNDFRHVAVRSVLALSCSLRASEFEVCWNSDLNQVYHIQYRSETTANTWADLGGPVPGTGSRICITDRAPLGEGPRSYRVLDAPFTVRASEIGLCWNSETNKTYQLQFTADLSSHIWTDIGAPVQGNGAFRCAVENLLPGPAQKFYRVITLP